MDGGQLTEIPMSTLGLGNNLIPISGGGYLRLYPYRVTDRYIEQKNQSGLPAMVYFHPWELDTEQKRLNVGAMKGFQHYVNLDSTEWKLSRLMERFFFTSVKENLQIQAGAVLVAQESGQSGAGARGFPGRSGRVPVGRIRPGWFATVHSHE